MTLATINELYQKDLDKLTQEISQYPSDESLWLVQDGISNSGGNLCLHLCGNLRHFLGAILNEDGYVRDREREFAAKGISREELMEDIEATKKAVANTLSALNADRLSESYPGGPFPDYTVLKMILHLYGHFGYHLGQLNYHRRLIAR